LTETILTKQNATLTLSFTESMSLPEFYMYIFLYIHTYSV